MSPVINLNFQGEGAWSDLQTKDPKDILDLTGPCIQPIQMALLDGGMKTGLPSIGIRVDFPDGRVFITETSARALVSAARAIQAKFPNLMEDP